MAEMMQESLTNDNLPDFEWIEPDEDEERELGQDDDDNEQLLDRSMDRLLNQKLDHRGQLTFKEISSDNPLNLPDFEYLSAEIEHDELNIIPPEPISKRVARDLPPQAIAPKRRDLISPKKITREQMIDEVSMVSVKEWSDDENRMELLRKFFTARYGEEGKQKPEQSNEEYFERFLTYKRALESNFINLGFEIDWIRSATVEDRDNLVDLYIDVENNIPNFFQAGGGATTSALLDYLWYNVSDPIVLLTGGIGKLFSKAAVETVKKTLISKGRDAALKQAKKIGFKRGAIIGAGVEGSGEVLRNVGLQRVQQANLDYPDVEIDPTQALVSGAIAGTVGGLGYGKIEKSSYADVVRRVDKRRKAIQKAKEKYKITEKDKIVSDKVIENINRKQQGELFDEDEVLSTTLTSPIDGKRMLDELGKVDNIDLLDTKVKNEVLTRLANVAETIFKDYEATGRVKELANKVGMSLESFLTLKANEMVRVLARTVQGQNLDPDLLQKALVKSGIDEDTFEAMAAVSWSEAGRGLAALSPLGKRIEKYRKANPNFAAALDELTQKKHTVSSNWFYKAYQGAKWLDRESRALAVIQLGTTVANIASLFTTQTLQVGANAIETAIHHMGKAYGSLATGQASWGGFKNGLSGVIKDTLAPLLFLDDPQLAQEMTDYMLKHNPNLARTIDRSMSGFDANAGLSQFSTLANHNNMMVDIYGRRAVFAAHVDRQLRRLGYTFDKFVAEDLELPAVVLKNSVRESLKATFAAMPRSVAQGGGVLEGVGHATVRFVEMLPFVPAVGTGQFPFARFTVNAIAHQLTYSPAGLVTELGKTTINTFPLVVNKILKRHGDEMIEATNPMEQQIARDRLAKGAVGLGLFVASVKYAAYLDENNEVIPATAIKADNGRVEDMTRYWPLGANLAIGRLFYHLWKNYTTDQPMSTNIDLPQFLRDFTGISWRTGNYSATTEDLVEMTLEIAGDLVRSGSSGVDNVAAEKLADKFGNYFGDVTGRPLTGLGFVKDILSFYSDTEAIERDPSQPEGQGFTERFVSAVKNRYKYRIPGLAQDLPVRERSTRGDPQYKQNPLLRGLFGTSTRNEYNIVEAELKKHGMKVYQVTVQAPDKTATQKINNILGPLVEKSVTRLVTSEAYKKLHPVEQKNEIKEILNGLNEVAKQIAENRDRVLHTEGGPTHFSRAGWMSLGARGRELAELVYSQMHGDTVANMQQAEPNVDHLSRATRLGKTLLRRYR